MAACLISLSDPSSQFGPVSRNDPAKSKFHLKNVEKFMFFGFTFKPCVIRKAMWCRCHQQRCRWSYLTRRRSRSIWSRLVLEESCCLCHNLSVLALDPIPWKDILLCLFLDIKVILPVNLGFNVPKCKGPNREPKYYFLINAHAAILSLNVENVNLILPTT